MFCKFFGTNIGYYYFNRLDLLRAMQRKGRTVSNVIKLRK